jgi:hypothetical protein
VVARVFNPETKRKEFVGPSVGDVVYSYLSESEACTTTFDDWCNNFGEDNDSLKALNTYLACQRNGMKLIRLLGGELAEELRQKELRQKEH